MSDCNDTKQEYVWSDLKKDNCFKKRAAKIFKYLGQHDEQYNHNQATHPVKKVGLV